MAWTSPPSGGYSAQGGAQEPGRPPLGPAGASPPFRSISGPIELMEIRVHSRDCEHSAQARSLLRSRLMAALASHQPSDPGTQWYVTRSRAECDLDELLDVVVAVIDALR